MLKLLIADNSEPFSAALAEAMGSDFEIKICYDGEAALTQLLSFQPDVLVINLYLPYKDGLTVLQETPFTPSFTIAISSSLCPYVERRSAELGVTYIMIAPAINALRVRILDIVQQTQLHREAIDLQAVTSTHLHILNFATHLDGYQQLCIAIPLYAADPSQRLSKELYPAVAKCCGYKDARSVEHSIRKAIEAAWKARDPVVWAKYFPPDKYGYQHCPTNKVFISRIAQYLHL